MRKATTPPVAPIVCTEWNELLSHLAEFPSPQLALDEEGEPVSSAWAFRGLQSWRYELEPAIEREARTKSMRWAGLEVLVRGEFKSRAPMHLGVGVLPSDDLDWLAYMQHYGVPTRLLDFTYSPFVGTYFALRDRGWRRHAGFVRLWAVDVAAVSRRFTRVAGKAAYAARKRKGTRFRPVSNNPDDFATERDRMIDETEGTRRVVMASLAASGTQRGTLNRSGCVCVALPTQFNPRLASQQGLFLLNCAEDLSFIESLMKMMDGVGDWCKVFDIARSALGEIEEYLFQMNVHEQSLFPDVAGLAGLVRQRVRLHWK